MSLGFLPESQILQSSISGTTKLCRHFFTKEVQKCLKKNPPELKFCRVYLQKINRG
jgi:hypothetical protein